MSPPDVDRIAIVAVSRPGAALARRLATSLTDAALYLERRTAGVPSDDEGNTELYDLPLRPVIQDLFARHRALVVLLPVGATVRLLAPVLGSKRQDPAVVCVDDAGRYAVSLLSGHVGGADALAKQVAGAIGAQAIVTSASDALGVTAIDLVGRASGWRVDATPSDLTRAAAAAVNGEPVALWLDPETGALWPDDAPPSNSIVRVANLADIADPRYVAALVVSDRLLAVNTGRPLVVYRPPTLVAGVGCRRGVEAEHLRGLLEATLRERGLSRMSLAKIGTADIKADEVGIIALADALSVPLETYGADQLNAVAERRTEGAGHGRELSAPTASAARDLLGVFGVSEPAAMLAAGADGVIVPRTKSDRATIAVARIPSTSGNVPEEIAMDHSETMLPGEALLATAEREIGKGNLREGAGLVWKAAMEALAAAAKRHGMPCGNRDESRRFVKYLDELELRGMAPSHDLGPFGGDVPTDQHIDMVSELSGVNFPRNLAAFRLAESYQEHREGLGEREGTEYEWEPDEYALYLEPMRDFIESLNSQ